jgi:phage terminase large subunit
MIEIKYVDKLHPVFTKPKRIKILVGGRGSSKSTAIADYVLARMTQGELWCCAREFQNSIEESVHRTMLDEIDRLRMGGFRDDKSHVYHSSGGRNFYRGLARNITSLKSTLSGIDGLWIEEGEDLSDNSLRVLTASVRLNAEDTEKKIAGEEIKMPEIIITMNRGSRTGAVARRFLARAEADLERHGYYEDDAVMIVEINYNDMPKSWFEASGLEIERADDEHNLSEEEYDHKWKGKYLEAVENPIILGKWFDACIDAHEKLGFKPRGVEVAAHDPSDEGNDPKGFAYRHGVVVKDVQEKETGDINEGCDWAIDLALQNGVDAFIWDCDGMGVALARPLEQALGIKKIELSMFKGSNSPRHEDRIFETVGKDSKTNGDTFANRRAQGYWLLRERMKNTYNAVVHGEYCNPDEMISFSSKIKRLDLLRAELSRLPKKPNGAGKIQLMSKKEMKANDIPSPNMADSVMMVMFYEPEAINKPITVTPIPTMNHYNR